MHKSVAEPRDDGKVSPKVGAVIWFPEDKSYEVAHRGELREGDHGEFTLLERKLVNRKLDDCILFTTLEPCMERNPPKVCCAKRIIKARIRTVYIGIQDPHFTVDGRGKEFLEQSGVKVEVFPRKFQEEIEAANADFRTRCNEEKSKKGREPAASSLDTSAPNVQWSDFSVDALREFHDLAKLPEDFQSDDFKRRLIRLNLYDREKDAPTRNGLILFGKEPAESIPEARVLLTIHHKEGSEGIENFDGPQALVPRQVLQWLRSKLPNPINRTDAARQEDCAIFFELIREGIVNAIVHRDYSIAGAKIQLIVTDESVQIRSPGHPVSPITLEQLQSFNAPVVSRNPTLHYVFNRMGLAEERGLGLKSLRSKAETAGLPLPRYSWSAPDLVLTIYRSGESAVEMLPDDIRKQLNDKELAGFEWLVKKGVITSREYAESQGLEKRAASLHLSKLTELGIVERIGEGKATKYRAIHSS